MVTVIFISILAVACAFMVYILVQFHLEARRPRRASLHFPRGVIVFRNGLASRPDSGAPGPKGQAIGFVDVKKSKHKTPLVLPLEIRRLTAKRVARS